MKKINFTQMGRSEELGTGIRNVYKYSKAYSGSEDIVFSEEDIFISKVPLGSLFRRNSNEKWRIKRRIK